MTRSGARRATLEAPAKINLLLRVLGRDEATGYHELETVFQAVGFTDRLTVELVEEGPAAEPGRVAPGAAGRSNGSGGIDLEVVGADVGPAEDNLVTRAARAFFDRSGRVGRLRIRLEKRIPAGAGLGGGSSDAAATLRALNTLFGEPLDGAALHDAAASLGADVPFFLCGSPTAVGRGRGDRLTPLPPLPTRPVLLVLPGVHVATGEAYGALARSRAEGAGPGGPPRSRTEGAESRGTPGSPAGSSAGSKSEPGGWTGAGARPGRRWASAEGPVWDDVAAVAVNDFESVVPDADPTVARALAAIRRTDADVALLSGSGSAVFGIYATEGAAEMGRGLLEAQGHQVVVTRTLERMPAPWLQAGHG